MISDSQPLEPCENLFLWSKPPGQWYLAAPANEHKAEVHCHPGTRHDFTITLEGVLPFMAPSSKTYT